MKRRGLLVVPLVALAGLALADGPQTDLAVQERLKQFQRDERLIEMLIESGVQLAAAEDPLKRAEECNRLADGLAREVKRAVVDRDPARASDLGRHLEALLVRGVAGNLQRARADLPLDSLRRKDFQRIGKESQWLMQPLEDEIERMTPNERERVQAVRKAVAVGLTEVEKALKSETPGKKESGLPSPPPAGKKVGAPKG
jgi:hypothetical protein